jgi:hypothetical protein
MSVFSKSLVNRTIAFNMQSTQCWSADRDNFEASKKIYVKVANTTHVKDRVKFWTKHYHRQDVQLFPGSNLNVPAYEKVEKLILLELGDLARNIASLHRDFPEAGRLHRLRSTGWNEPCVVTGCEPFYHLFWSLQLNNSFRHYQPPEDFHLSVQ